MNSKSLWERYCNFYNYYPTVGISLDISRIRFADDLFTKMSGKINEAFSSMQALEKGEIVNPDEGRMVGHYWLRSPELSPSVELKNEITSTFQNIENFARDVHSGKIAPEKGGKFSKVVVIGIGGSALGPQLVADALGTRQDKMEVLFCDNTDPDGMARVIQTLGDELKNTLCIVISKSGGTAETRNGAIEFAQGYKRKGLSFAKHVVAVTMAGSKLDKQAESEGWVARIPMWDWVGGRTSLFSAVGLVPAALQGIDIASFVKGAREMDAITRTTDVKQNPSMLLALMWYSVGGGAGKKDMVVLPYKDRLTLFSKYLQQLVMESLGKEKNLKGEIVNQGIAVYGNKGSTDQHAYVQQLRDGLNNFFVTFIQVLRDQTSDSADFPVTEVEPGITCGDYLTGFMLGTRRALFENQRDSVTLSVDFLDAKSLGALIALYDRTVGFYASLVGINAYHQPGVEAGKKAAARVLELQKSSIEALDKKKGSAMTAEEVATAAGAADEVETIYKVLEHLAANPHSKVSAQGERHPAKMKFARG